MTEAARLTRPLLLIHGLADDNVVVAHTLRMSAALLAAGRPHQVLPLSGATHMPADSGSQLLRHELAFLAESLGAARPDAGLRRQAPKCLHGQRLDPATVREFRGPIALAV
jgi:dipeptidyl-peptidase-4